MFCELGTYCVTTNRVITFDEYEIKERLKSAPSSIPFGEGRDRRWLKPRKPESKEPPWCFLGAAGAPVSSEDVLLTLVESYAKIPYINSVTIPALTRVGGLEIRPGSPLEVLGVIRNVILAREALRRAGRPGLPIMNAVPSASTAMSLISALHPDYGLRRSDGFLIAVLAELKTDFEMLSKACAVKCYGAPIAAEIGTVYGGYAGGPEGTAIVNVAEHIMGAMVYDADWYLPFPVHVNYTAPSTREMLWVRNIAAQAISRNTHLPTIFISYVAAGPFTEMCLYEIAAQISTIVASGASIEAVGVAKAAYVDRFTPLEPRFASEVAYASLDFKLSDLNDIIKKYILPKYEDKIANPPLGKKFQECCDIRTGRVCKEYLELYNRIKHELSDLGFKFITPEGGGL